MAVMYVVHFTFSKNSKKIPNICSYKISVCWSLIFIPNAGILYHDLGVSKQQNKRISVAPCKSEMCMSHNWSSYLLYINITDIIHSPEQIIDQNRIKIKKIVLVHFCRRTIELN